MTEGNGGLEQPLLLRNSLVLLVRQPSRTTNSAGGFLGLSNLASVLITEDGEPSLRRLNKGDYIYNFKKYLARKSQFYNSEK